MCESTVTCKNIVRTECAPGTFFETGLCRSCPRSNYCSNGEMKQWPSGSATAGFSSHNVSYCHCMEKYMHTVDTSLAAGFYCSKTGPQNQVVISDIQKIRNFNARDIVYHVTTTHSTALFPVSVIVLIEPEKYDLSIHFMESNHMID